MLTAKANSLIPAAALTYLNELLHGGQEISHGLLWYADRFKELDDKMRAVIEGPATADMIREQMKIGITSPNFIGTTKFIAAQINVIERLRDDTTMTRAYNLLTSELKDGRQLRGFLSGALRAGHDFNRHRDAKRKGQELVDEIAQTANKLSVQLRKLKNLSLLELPEELFSIRSLLANENQDEDFSIQRNLWMELRKHIVGPDPRIAGNDSEAFLGKPHPLLYEIAKEDFNRMWKQIQLFQSNFLDAQDELQLAWTVAPDLSTILKTVSDTAERFADFQSGVVEMTVKNRSKLKKSTFIRAFGYILSKEYNVVLSAPVRQAMAATTMVVLNDPEIQLNEDDVRKALLVLSKGYPEIRLE